MSTEWDDPDWLDNTRPWYSPFLTRGWISVYMGLVALLIAALYQLEIVSQSVGMVGLGILMCGMFLAMAAAMDHLGRAL